MSRRYVHQCWSDEVEQAKATSSKAVALCGRSIVPLAQEKAIRLELCATCTEKAKAAEPWTVTVTTSTGGNVTWVGSKR